MIQEAGRREKITKFTDLYVWQEGHELVLLVYRLTDSFPKNEAYGLTSQMRRATVSVTSNIAEGFGRKGGKEKLQFYYLAQGSLIETKNQLFVARDVKHATVDTINKIIDQANLTHRLLQGLITSTKNNLDS